jgi:glycosyltransferase involved in cell wall biosynthesis
LVFPPERGSARRVGELALSFARKGHTISVVTAFPNYPKAIVFPGYKRALLQKDKWDGGVTVYRVYTCLSGNRQSTIGRVLTYLSFSVFSFLGLMCGPKPDLVYVASPPYFLGITGWLASILRDARFVLDVQDLWPDAPIALGYVKSKWMICILQGLERFIYSRAALVLTISETMRMWVSGRTKDGSKVALSYNWVNFDQYNRTDGHELRTRLGLENAFVLLFAGNIGKAQNLETLLEAAQELRSIDDIQFVILGDGVEKDRLKDRADGLSLKKVSFLDSVREDQVPEYLGMADVLLVTLGRARHREAAIPSKLQVYMACEKPILMAAEGASADVVKRAQCGLVVPAGNGKALADAVITLKNMSVSERRKLGQTGRKFAEEHFSMVEQCARIEAQLVNLGSSEMHATPA